MSERFARPYQKEEEKKEKDMDKKELEEVARPRHYLMSGIETFDEMILVFGVENVKSYCKVNAWKYRARAPYKGNQEKDMAKAAWYLQKLKELESCS